MYQIRSLIVALDSGFMWVRREAKGFSDQVRVGKQQNGFRGYSDRDTRREAGAMYSRDGRQRATVVGGSA